MATRWPEAVPLRGVSAAEVAEAFVGVVSHTGLPDTVLTDQGTVFTGRVFWKACEILGCGHITTTPYHPQGNGVVERLPGTLKPMLAKACQEGGWIGSDSYLWLCLPCCRCHMWIRGCIHLT